MYCRVLDDAIIQEEAICFYSDLISDMPTSDHESILQYIPSLVTSEDNQTLLAIPQLAEVKEVVCPLSSDSVAGLDGFHGKFYRHCLEVINENVLKAVQEFFLSVQCRRP